MAWKCIFGHQFIFKKSGRMLVHFLIIVVFVSRGAEGLLVSAGNRLPQIDLIHRVELDQRGAYVLLWTPEENGVIFEMQVRTKGYVGLGFSPSGEMKGSDIVIGWIDREGDVHFSDRHASGQRTPGEDKSQDYNLLGGYANDTHTVLRFSRPWVTCDKDDDFPITNDTIRVIWAYDASLPDPSKATLSRHDHRGTKSLYLREPKLTQLDDSSKVKTWDIRSPGVELPGDLNTLYWCRLYKAPTLSRKHHIIGYLPLIDEVSLPHVHHMLLYECTLSKSEFHLEKWIKQKGAQCYTRNMPLSWTACEKAIVAWAIGSQGEMLPNHVGFPVGEEQGGANYYLLEIHYDNPKLMKGIVDRSGLRMLYTDELRQYDAGVLTFGHKVGPAMIIPPRKVWSTTAHCPSECTKKTLPESGIKVISGILHAHLLGESISLQHIRKGIELEPLIEDNTYDFNYQQARFFSPEKVIKPGDHLITTCRYNAERRTKPTFGGFATEDEMCLVFLAYYPRQNISQCYSRPDLALLLDVFGIKNLFENDKTMKSFSDDDFDENKIDLASEEEVWKRMSLITRPGEESSRLRLVDFLRNVNISEPESLRSKSFYDVLMNDSTWRDINLALLEDAVTKQQYEPTCLYNGRIVVKGLPKKGKIRHFIAYKSPPKACYTRSNWTTVLQTDLPISPPNLDEPRLIQEVASGQSIGNNNQLPQPSQSRERSKGTICTSHWISLVGVLCLFYSIL